MVIKCFVLKLEWNEKKQIAEKWDAPFVGENVIPMWVADMDFEIAPNITRRLVKTAEQGAFGYQFLSDDYYNAIIDFLRERHDYQVKKEWICYVPNVVLGLFLALSGSVAKRRRGNHTDACIWTFL